MRTFIVVLAFALVFTASCGLLKKAPKKDILSLAEIDNHHLGKTLLNLITIHMKAQGAIDQIPILLQEIFDDLVAKDAENEETNERQQQQCADSIAKYQNQIRINGEGFEREKNIADQADANLIDLNNKLNDLNNLIESTETAISEGTNLRNEQRATYEADIADNEDAIEAANAALVLINSLRNGGSFVQLKSKFQKVSEKLSNTKSKKHAHLYTPLITALTQLASRADRDAIERIYNLLDELEKQLQASKVTIEQTENEQATRWASELEDLTGTLSQARKDRDETIESIADEEKIRDDARLAQANFLAEVERDTDLLRKTEADCEAKRIAYENNRDELSREIEIVGALQDHFEEKIAGLSDFLDNRPDF